MLTSTIDLAAIGTTSLFFALSVLLGLALGAAGSLASFAGTFIFAFALAIAGDRKGINGTTSVSLPLLVVRTIIYIGAGIGAIVLAAFGYTGLAYALSIPAGIALGIALIRLAIRF